MRAKRRVCREVGHNNILVLKDEGKIDRQTHTYVGSRNVGDGDLDGVQNSHGTHSRLVQLIAHTRLQTMRLEHSLGHGDTKLRDVKLAAHCTNSDQIVGSHDIKSKIESKTIASHHIA
jgi:hypothetical protein